MNIFQKKEIYFQFIKFFFVLIFIEVTHLFFGLPLYDLTYLGLITIFLLLGDIFVGRRIFVYACVLLLLDFSPAFIFLPIFLIYIKYKQCQDIKQYK